MATRTLISASAIRRGRGRALYLTVLGVTSVVFLLAFFFPLYWMVTGALKAPVELARSKPTFVPQSFEPSNYAHAWTRLDIAHYFMNTAFYAIAGWLVQLILDVRAAHALPTLRPGAGQRWHAALPAS